MKTFLLIYMISMHDGQQPTVQKIEQPDMPTCQAQAKSTLEQLSFKMHFTSSCTPNNCSPPYLVRASCVTGS